MLEPQPTEAFTRAKQYLGQYDISTLHPSMDLFGGGGLVMTTQQLVLFMQSLFEGHIFDNRHTLTEMLSVGHHEGAEKYRLSLFAHNFNGITVYSHLGFGDLRFITHQNSSYVSRGLSIKENIEHLLFN